ncbi:hypothetical protein EDF36_0172 [Rathayibacter sp. PhB152]|uniref:DUF2264 domain-containing protein n=1 Tax=Rathayibacter sp. PhB152 TaxID=2485190 RepID=UPI000F92554B|nr:DUF2264 domain-containing protein [Rathayibacter sp. PhB152]ROQ64676.1 hypothetical protein EDF36_0172 [Rathayibacter sp. PhB152]
MDEGNLRADWTREHWLAVADALLAAVAPFASAGHGRITLPGAEGGYGRAVDGLEGFARTFLLAGFRIAGARGEGVDDLIDFYRRGVETGVDPDAEDRWVRIDEHAQAKVEAASIALVLDLTRPWIWDRLDARTQQRVVDYLAPVVGDDSYPQTNWVWFRLVVETFLRSVGGPWSAQDVAADLARHDSFVREDGWLADGSERAYDHYVGWALHMYPVLWARMSGAAELAAPRAAADVARLDRYLSDALALVGGDGSPLLQGRSLIYRFAAAAPFWAGVIAEVPSHSPGRLRRAASAIVGHFAENSAPDADGLLSMGWHDPWRELAQSYSGPGSPYWAVKGMLGILLPAEHPVWSAASEPLPADLLPIEQGDDLRAIVSPGWIVSGTHADGIVRVVNHGTDKALPGATTGDSPLYARLGYSTATAPLLDERGWAEALEQSVALVDADGDATHRTGMTLTEVRLDADGRVGVAGSSGDAHWITPERSSHRHGEGLRGAVRVAGRISVHSLVRGPWELRLVRIDELAEGVRAEEIALRIGGWPLAGAEIAADTSAATAEASNGRLTSRLSLLPHTSLTPGAVPEVVARDGASPLGPAVGVPTITLPAEVDALVVALVGLTGEEAAGAEAPSAGLAAVDVATDGDALSVTATWPDGLVTEHRLPDSGRAARQLRYPRTRGGVPDADAKEQHA